MTPSLYDLLDVEPTASDAEIRAAWKSAIADLDPTDRRFRAYNQAAEILLDPTRRSAYDADLAAAAPDEEPEPAPDQAPEQVRSPAPSPSDPRPGVPTHQESAAPAGVAAGRTVPVWLLLALAVSLVVLIAVTAYVWSLPSDDAVEEATRSAQTAAEAATVAVLSYDAGTLEEDQANAQQFITSDYRKKYDDLFEVILDNAPATETKVEVEVISSAIVRSGEDRAAILLFINRPTTNKQQAEPVVYKDQVTVTMERVGDEWLIDDMETSPVAP